MGWSKIYVVDIGVLQLVGVDDQTRDECNEITCYWMLSSALAEMDVF
jgi:hypothetical protein